MENPEVTSPEAGGRSDLSGQNHVEVRACLQITRNGWNIGEVVKDTRWWSRSIIKVGLIDSLTFCIADVYGNNCSLRVLGVGREICNSGPDSIETQRRVRRLSALKWE